MKPLTAKGARKLKRRRLNRVVRKARRDAIGGNIKTPPISIRVNR